MSPTFRENYVPFGEEWEAELLKLPKKQLVAMYRNACIQRIQAKAVIQQTKISIPEKLFERLEYFRELLVNHESQLLGQLHEGKAPPEVLKNALEIEIGRCQETRSILEEYIAEVTE